MTRPNFVVNILQQDPILVSYDLTKIKNTTGINDLDVSQWLIPYMIRNFHHVIHFPQYQELTVMGVLPDIITNAILDCCRRQRNATHTSRISPGAV